MTCEDRAESFINTAKKLYGNQYDYSCVKYINARIKVDIVCKKHGVFGQTPDNHLHGHGCKNCNGGTVSNTKDFIKKAKLKHNKKYKYHYVVYKNNRIKVKIICKNHGMFMQTPSEHLNGSGCNRCGIDSLISKKTLTTEEFIRKAKKMHGNTYDYSLSEYVNSKTKIAINCKKHGVFYQRSNAHISGQGCCICRESMGEKKIKLFLENNNIYFIRQKRFNNCRNKQELPFDFYLPKYNICIEFDGMQHYYPTMFHGTKIEFKEIKNRDKIKTKYCSGINGRPKLIRISYKNYKNIEHILSNKLNITSQIKH